MQRDFRLWFPVWIVPVSLLVLASGWFLYAMRASKSADPMLLWWFPLTALLVVLVSIRVHGLRPAFYSTVISIFIIGSAWQVHAGFRTAYLDGDVAIDTLIYNTTSPDVNQLARDLEEVSLLVFGDTSLGIQIEACDSLDWPFRRAMRDFPNVDYFRSPATERAPIIIGSTAEWSGGKCDSPEVLPGYTTQQLVLRWHEPESDIYRKFAVAPELEPYRSAWQFEERDHGPLAIVASVFDSVSYGLTPEGQRRLINLLMYRSFDDPLNPFYFNVYIRNDLLPYFNEVRYGR